MYDPVILISVLDDIEQKTRNGSIPRTKLNYNDQKQQQALDYLLDERFVSCNMVDVPTTIYRVTFTGYKFRHELKKQLQNEQEQIKLAEQQRQANKDVAETRKDTAAIRRMTLAILKIGLTGLAVALVGLAVTISQCDRPVNSTLSPKQPAKQSAPAQVQQEAEKQ